MNKKSKKNNFVDEKLFKKLREYIMKTDENVEKIKQIIKLNIDKKAVVKLKKENGIYLLSNGRINFGGISNSDILRVSSAMKRLFVN